MLNKVSCILAKELAKSSEPEKEPIYIYGLELIISTVIGLIAILIISVALSNIRSGILFIFVFVPLRLFTGGYHAATYYQCFIITNISYMAVLILKNMLWNKLPFGIWLCLFICVSVYIIKNAPAINVHQPINKYKQMQSKRMTRYILAADGIWIVYLFVNNKELMSMAILSICLIAAFMLIAGQSFLIRKERINDEISC